MRRILPLISLISLAFAPAPLQKPEHRAAPGRQWSEDVLTELYAPHGVRNVPGAVEMAWKVCVLPNKERQDVSIESVSLEWSPTGAGGWSSIGPTYLENT